MYIYHLVIHIQVTLYIIYMYHAFKEKNIEIKIGKHL